VSVTLQIPHPFRRLSDAVNIRLNIFESKYPADFTYIREKAGFEIEYFRPSLLMMRQGYRVETDLGFIRLRPLNAKLTEMVIEDSKRLADGPDSFLDLVQLWDEDEQFRVPIKKRKAEAKANFESFNRIHEELRQTILEGLKEDRLLLGEHKATAPSDQPSDAYVDKSTIASLRQIRSSNFDLQRLIRLCDELNKCSTVSAFCATAALVRAIIDHVPPIFGARTFAEVANNLSEKSVKASLLRLETSSRDISDSVLHQQVRKREVVPSRTQVNFSNDLEVLLREIIRRLS
jgi:hypothetical protein